MFACRLKNLGNLWKLRTFSDLARKKGTLGLLGAKFEACTNNILVAKDVEYKVPIQLVSPASG